MGSQEENYTAPITVESESVQDGPSLRKDSDLQVRAITPYGKYKSISKKLYLQLCQNFVNNFTKIYIIFTRLTLSNYTRRAFICVWCHFPIRKHGVGMIHIPFCQMVVIFNCHAFPEL